MRINKLYRKIREIAEIEDPVESQAQLRKLCNKIIVRESIKRTARGAFHYFYTYRDKEKDLVSIGKISAEKYEKHKDEIEALKKEKDKEGLQKFFE